MVNSPFPRPLWIASLIGDLSPSFYPSESEKVELDETELYPIDPEEDEEVKEKLVEE